MKYLLLMISTLIISCSSSDVKKEEASYSVKLNVKSKELSNGLKVILVNNPKLPIFSYYTFYKVGSIYETPGITGASHFLEHMMFKGAKKYAQGEFDKIIEGNGGSNNAYTTNDLTVYYEKMPLAALEKVIDLEADRMVNLTLGVDSFEKERDVVLEERKMRYENSPGGQLHLEMMQKIFEKTPYGRSVIGDIADLKSVTRDQIHAYFKKFYSPNNAVIVIAGDLDFDSTFSMIEDKFGGLQKYEGLEEEKVAFEKPSNFTFKGKFNKSYNLYGTSPMPMFSLAYQGVKFGRRDSYVLDILSSILGDGKSSYLNQNYVQAKKPIFTYVGASNYTLMKSGVFYVSGQLLPGVKLRRAERDLKRTLSRSCNEKIINQRSLDKIKNQYRVSTYSQLLTNSGMAQMVGNAQAYHGDWTKYEDELKTYDDITLSEVISECKKLFKNNKSIFLSVWNKNKKVKK
jgi:zinc protease